MYYTAIGPDRLPIDPTSQQEMLIQMTKVAERLARLGFILRTGFSPSGTQRAFRMGVENVFGNDSQSMCDNMDLYSRNDLTPFCINISKCYYYRKGYRTFNNNPAWQVLLVIGPHGDEHSKFVICWTPNGAESELHVNSQSGDAGLCITVARDYKIPVINMKRKDALDKLDKVLAKIEKEKSNGILKYPEIPKTENPTL